MPSNGPTVKETENLFPPFFFNDYANKRHHIKKIISDSLLIEYWLLLFLGDLVDHWRHRDIEQFIFMMNDNHQNIICWTFGHYEFYSLVFFFCKEQNFIIC